MGMFDYLTVHYPLPTIINLPLLHFNEMNFQTKSFERAMDSYEIREDGSLWWEDAKYEWTKAPRDDGTIFSDLPINKKIEEESVWKFCGTCNKKITFYDSVFRLRWVEYDAKFKDGILQNVICTNDYFRSVKDVVRYRRKLGEF